MLTRPRAAAAVVCLLLAVMHTWPLASHPGRYSRNDNADTELNEWILAWVEHQLPRDPAHLFEANIFYPAHDALAFSEPLIVPALIGAPAAWSGAGPVLVYNLVLIAGFALTAFATALVIERWSGDLVAGLVAGSAFAFNTHTLTRLPHVQAVHLYALPLALLAADDVMVGASTRAAIGLALCLATLAYTSGYLAVFAMVMMGVAVVVRAPEWVVHWRRVLPRLGGAAVATALMVLPIYLPYRRVALDQHMIRPLAVAVEYSARLPDYLATAGALHFRLWSHRFFAGPVEPLFPGVAVLVLTAAAGLAAWRRRDKGLARRVIVLSAIAAAGVLLSLGPATVIYRLLFRLLPPMQGMRAAARFGNLFLLGTALLAGLGLAACRAGLAKRRLAAGGLGVAALILVNAEALRAPFDYAPYRGIPAPYRLLADVPGRVVLAEQPFYPAASVQGNADYVLASTAHWRPLMNGYSGYVPAAYSQRAQVFFTFPSDAAIAAMQAAGVTHVMVHPDRYFDRDPAAVLRGIGARTDLELIASDPGGVRLYRLLHR